jgi:hypothetical protein
MEAHGPVPAGQAVADERVPAAPRRGEREPDGARAQLPIRVRHDRAELVGGAEAEEAGLAHVATAPDDQRHDRSNTAVGADGREEVPLGRVDRMGEPLLAPLRCCEGVAGGERKRVPFGAQLAQIRETLEPEALAHREVAAIIPPMSGVDA